jgi:glycosidase
MNSGTSEIFRIEPPNWWVGMKEPLLQLLVYGKNISTYEVRVNHKSINLIKVGRVENSNYLFLDLLIDKSTEPGTFLIDFFTKSRSFEVEYELLKREDGENRHKGFDQSDVVYLIMPDRFSNGNPELDNVEGMHEKADRNNPDGRHGGDLQGILKHLDYFVDLGVTALWLNPVFENNMPQYSYHGYAITDFYKIDPRLGTNEGYKQLVEECHKKGLKVIMDMVFNHCGTEHWFIKNLPSNDWIHQFPDYTQTNSYSAAVSDPYASEFDFDLLQKGWFDTSMPDLNQKNPYLANYLIQNSLWWIEYSGMDGIRMDTYPYPDKAMMARWAKRVLKEYPEFNIVGESWLQKESMTAYWQQNFQSKDRYQSYLPSVTDFPLNAAIIRALNEPESVNGGLLGLYYTLAQDFLYPNANKNLIFLDNHDLNRIYTSLHHNFNKFKVAMSILLTIRGIPQIYYGTEILMDGTESKGHGYIRQDFPGGWLGDKKDVFGMKNLTHDQVMALGVTKRILNWRKKSKAVHQGKLTHFVPENGIYVYFKGFDNEVVMVVVNKDDARSIPTLRFHEVLKNYNSCHDVVTDEYFTDLSSIWMDGYSARILKLMK